MGSTIEFCKHCLCLCVLFSVVTLSVLFGIKYPEGCVLLGERGKEGDHIFSADCICVCCVILFFLFFEHLAV